MKNYASSIDDINSIYAGFPLKKDWQVAGGKALLAHEEDIVRAPELADGKICFTMAISYYFDDEQLLDIALDSGLDVETEDEARTALPEEAEIVHGENVTISVREKEGRPVIEKVEMEYCVLDHERKPLDWDIYPEVIDEDYAFLLIESFLDAAVNAE